MGAPGTGAEGLLWERHPVSPLVFSRNGTEKGEYMSMKESKRGLLRCPEHEPPDCIASVLVASLRLSVMTLAFAWNVSPVPDPISVWSDRPHPQYVDVNEHDAFLFSRNVTVEGLLITFW